MPKLAFTALVLLVAPIAFAADGARPAATWRHLDCPESIKVNESLAGAPDGWRAFFDTVNTRYLLSNVAFYDGKPEELASLAPDDEDAKEPTWTFSRSRAEAIWQVCIYQETGERLAREVPADVTTCRVRKDHAVECR